MRQLVGALVIALTIGIVSAPVADAAQSFDSVDLSDVPRDERDPKIGGPLQGLLRHAASDPVGAISAMSIDGGVDGVKVIVRAAGAVGDAIDAIGAVGGREIASVDQLVKAIVPLWSIAGLAERLAVAYVDLPRPAVKDAISQGVSFSNATAWKAAGVAGKGVKIAVIDAGFAGYDARKRAGELPNATRIDYCDGDIEAEEHGTGVAEIIYDMAPSAQLYLICVGDSFDLARAERYAKTQGVHIVSMSLAYPNSSRGDGKGISSSPEGIVKDAAAAGILWVNSAGNYARTHWSGTLKDTDRDGWHDFASDGDETNSFELASGEGACVHLKWDNWPTTSTDYDLYLYRSDGTRVAESTTYQRAGAGYEPTEWFCYTNRGSTARFGAGIFWSSGSKTQRLDVIVTGDLDELEYRVAAGSISEPATSDSALAVGAMCWDSTVIASYSSLGPTIDKRVKPDITGPASVSGATYGAGYSGCYGGFAGTSAAAPHVAAAAALVKEANPSYTATQLRSYLEGRAVDIGTTGKDSTYGFGKLWLGAPGAAATPTPSPTASATPNPTATPKASATPTPTASTHSVQLTVTSPVKRGAKATATAKTSGRATCSITVTYSSGKSTASGLYAKTASSTGSVSWTWTVGSRTTIGSWPVDVTCTSTSKQTATARQYFTVQ